MVNPDCGCATCDGIAVAELPAIVEGAALVRAGSVVATTTRRRA